MKSGYFTLLDPLRFVCALMVLGFHYFFGFLGITSELSFFRYGNFGVQIFFIISGFVIAHSLANKTVLDFAKNRFVRLFPIFWITCTLTYIFTLLVKNAQPVSLAEYFISMTMLGDKLSQFLGYGRLVDPSYWSLTVELTFYVGIAFFVSIFTWKHIRYFILLWFIVSVLAYIFALDQTFVMKLLLVRHASYFIFGILLSLIVSENYTSIKTKIFDYIFLVVTMVYSTVISIKALPAYFAPNPLDAVIIAALHPLSFIIIILLVYLSKHITNTRLIALFSILGGLTYPLYLIHQTVGKVLIENLTTFISQTHAAILVTFFIIVVSFFLFKLDNTLRKDLLNFFRKNI